MNLVFLSIVYFLSVRLFPICCVGVLSVSLGGENDGVSHLHNWNLLV